MEHLKIVASARQVPSRLVTNDELSTMMDTNDDWIYTRTGIRQRQESSPQKNTTTYAFKLRNNY